MKKRFVPILLIVATLVCGIGFGSTIAQGMAPAAQTFTVTASKVSFVSGVPNSDKNWAQANVPCSGSSNFKLSTKLWTWPFNPANWSSQWCKNNVVQIGIPSAFYLYVWPLTGPYSNPANWKVTYSR